MRMLCSGDCEQRYRTVWQVSAFRRIQYACTVIEMAAESLSMKFGMWVDYQFT